jgi:amino acid permease
MRCHTAGVLALPYALGTLGLIAGPICILAFFVVAYCASQARRRG